MEINKECLDTGSQFPISNILELNEIQHEGVLKI